MKSTKRFALRMSVMSVLAAAGLFTACDKNTPEPTPGTGEETVTWPKAADGITNQYQYNNAKLVDIKNVVYSYSEENGTYCFAFSTTEGEESVEGVLKNDEKAAILVVPTVNGAVDTTKTFGFQLGDGKELSVLYNKLTGKEHSVKVSVTLKDETHAAVSIEYVGETPESPYFFLKYEGEAIKEEHPLNNEMEREDGTRTEIKSVFEIYQHSASGSQTELRLYDKVVESYTATDASPVLVISYGGDVKSVDFAAIKDRFLVKAGDNFVYSYKEGESATPATGSFSVGENEDGGLTISLDLTVSGKTVKLEYKCAVKALYASDNSLTITNGEKTETYGVHALFREVKDGKCRLVLGSKEGATTPAELKDGEYAVSVTIPADKVGSEFDLVKATDCVVEVYDYVNYTTSVYDAEHLGEGVVAVFADPNKDGKNLFLHLEELKFGSGLFLDGSYYGAVTDAEIPDLTPVKPFTPTITITNEGGTKVLFQETITRMEVCHFVDTYDFAGKLVNGYGFYFVNAKSDADVDDNKYTNTPLFILPDSKFGCENLDLASASASDPELYWSIAFANTNLSVTDAYSPAAGTYGYDITNYAIYRVPENVTLTAKRDGKNWDFKLVLKDWGPFGMSYTGSAPEANGTKNVLTIEWHGPATKYSGTKYSNTLTDQAY